MSRRTASTQDDKPSSPKSAAARSTEEAGRPQPKQVDLRGQALAPDLEAIGRFIRDMIKRGAIVELITSVLALLQRMREINTELMARIATKSRKRPPSETLARLQLELPLLFGAIANDTACAELEGPPEPPTTDAPPKDASSPPKSEPKSEPELKKERGRHNHGRPNLPDHLERVCGESHRVSGDLRICPTCKRPLKTVGFKTTEKLTVRPCEFVVEQHRFETCSCGKCHAHIVSAPKPDEIVPRGILGNELLVQAAVDHYDNAVPWERMAETARQQDVPLSANTLAASVGAAIDRFEPVVEHIKEKALASSYTALDATSMKVLDTEHPLGIRTGSLWLIEGDHQYAYFVFAKTAEADPIDDLLRGRTLASVMCDGSPTNNCVERAGGRRGGCNAHARRKLVEAVRLGDARAVRGLELFAKLFHVDAESKPRALSRSRSGGTITARAARASSARPAPTRAVTRRPGSRSRARAASTGA